MSGNLTGVAVVDPNRLLDLLDGTDNEVARRLGVTRRTIVRWRAGDRAMARHLADEYAIRCGHHPSYLWPEDFGPDAKIAEPVCPERCPHDHEMTAENAYLVEATGAYKCRMCMREAGRRHDERRRLRRLAQAS